MGTKEKSLIQAIIDDLITAIEQLETQDPMKLWTTRRLLKRTLHKMEKIQKQEEQKQQEQAIAYTGYDREWLLYQAPVNTREIFPGEVFANTADFDSGIRQLLPRYDEMLNAIAHCIPPTAQRILELGCGTGELSLKILHRCPSAQIIALDYSPRMLQFAKNKIESAGYLNRWTGIEADFGDWTNEPDKINIGIGFDAGVSSLAIHHLTNEMKLKLFQRIRESLNRKGVFWNADPILPESPALAAVYQAVREEWAAFSRTTLAEIRAKIGKSAPHGYSHPDQLATLDNHLQMLKTAGFETVAAPWKYYGLAVFGGGVS
ncbi:methyltransferase domain-containing protein [Microseira sp. BLCC-F43]|jgi:trans-aconitate 2-methyltransferase|uniref:class I SAM-dependent methyltransferase n=1 Tax=Microseira sp. BLCC-F43 TaxID=3153602 RepID=UPI0035B8CCEA